MSCGDEDYISVDGEGTGMAKKKYVEHMSVCILSQSSHLDFITYAGDLRRR